MAALGLGLKEQAIGATTGLCTGEAARKRRANDRIGFKVLFSIGAAQFALLSFILHSQKSHVQLRARKKNLPMTLQVESTRIQLDSQIRAELKIHGLSLLTPSIRVKAGHRILTWAAFYDLCKVVAERFRL